LELRMERGPIEKEEASRLLELWAEQRDLPRTVDGARDGG
jgi:hypothetical protein